MTRRFGNRWLTGFLLFTGVMTFAAACGGGAASTPTAAQTPTPKPQTTSAVATATQAVATATTAAPTATTAATKAPATSVPQATPTRPPSPQSPTPAGGKQPKAGGTLAVMSYVTVANFDVHQNTSVSVSSPMRQAYNTLVRMDETTYSSIVPELASKWAISTDGTVYTFDLRPGVKWHDGQTLTSDEVAYSIRREIDPSVGGFTAPRGSTLLAAVAKVEAPDATHVRITLKNPSAAFLWNLSSDWNMVLPEHVIKVKGDMKTTVIGTGPFKLNQYVPGASVTFLKNPDYFVPGRPYLNGVNIFIVTDAGARLAAFRSRQVILGAVASGAINNLSDQKTLKKDFGDKIIIQSHASFSPEMIHMNQKVAPWTDPKVRRAVNLALNRQQAIDFGGQGGTIGGFMDPLGTWGLPIDEVAALPGLRAQKDADVAEAKRLMAEAGFGSGIQATMKVSNLYTIHEVYQQQLKAIGVNVQLQPLDTPLITKTLADGDYGVASFPIAHPADDPDIMLGAIFQTGSARNSARFSDPQVDKTLGQIAVEIDTTKRKQLTNDLDRQLLKADTGEVVVFWRSFYRMWWSDLQNYKQGPGAFTGWVFENVWLDQG